MVSCLPCSSMVRTNARLFIRRWFERKWCSAAEEVKKVLYWIFET